MKTVRTNEMIGSPAYQYFSDKLRFTTALTSIIIIAGLAMSSVGLAEKKPADAPSAKNNKPSASEVKENIMKERAITNTYVHGWLRLPKVIGKKVGSSVPFIYEPQKGIATVVIFLASWCLPCQHLIDDFKELEKKYENRATDFIYVFSHDTNDDARAFVNTHNLKGTNIQAGINMLDDFHKPELPSIYIADRQNWLVHRCLKTDRACLGSIDNFLRIHTSF